MDLSVALLQLLPVEMDQDYNRRKGIAACTEAKALGADLALFPEMWNIGYAGCPFDAAGRTAWEQAAIGQESPFFQTYVALARRLELYIALTYLQAYTPQPRNAVAIISPAGTVTLEYAKVYLCNFGRDELQKADPDYESIGCDYHCSPGNTFPTCVITTRGGTVTVGAMICADREFPEPATELMQQGAELILVPNACTWDLLRAMQLRVRAFDTLVGIAMANYPAPHDNGQSSAYHCVAWDRRGVPTETRIVELGSQEMIGLARFDVDAIRDFRARERWRLEYRTQRPF